MHYANSETAGMAIIKPQLLWSWVVPSYRSLDQTSIDIVVTEWCMIAVALAIPDFAWLCM